MRSTSRSRAYPPDLRFDAEAVSLVNVPWTNNINGAFHRRDRVQNQGRLGPLGRKCFKNTFYLLMDRSCGKKRVVLECW